MIAVAGAALAKAGGMLTSTANTELVTVLGSKPAASVRAFKVADAVKVSEGGE